MYLGCLLSNKPAVIIYLLLLIVTTSSQASFAQENKKIDSLAQLLSVSKPDTNRVKTLNNLSWDLLNTGDYEPAMKYAEEALMLAEKLSFRNGVYYAYMRMGNILMYQGNNEQALNNFLLAQKIAEETGNKTKRAQTDLSIGNIFYMDRQLCEALEKYSQSLKLWKETGNSKEIAGTYLNMANIYSDQGNSPLALEKYFEALKTYEAVGDKKEMSNCYTNIGLIYPDLDNDSVAIKYHILSLKIDEELGDKNGMALCNNNIGISYVKQKNYAEAFKHFFEALKFSEEMKDQMGGLQAQYNIGNLYYEINNFTEATKWFLPMIKIGEDLNDKQTLVYAYYGLTKAYSSQKKMTIARTYALKGLSISKELDLESFLRDFHSELAKIDYSNKDYKSAYDHYKESYVFRNSVSDEENNKKTTRLAMRYEFSKKEDSLKFQQTLTDEKLMQQTMLTRQQRQTKNYLMAGLVLFAILSFFVYRNYRTRQQLKLQQLRNKIASDLHDDVGSTLSSISIFSQLAQQQSKEVIPMLETIGDSSRKMLDAMADIVWTINPENDQFEKIILRMRGFAFELLGAKNIDFEFVADDEVSKMKLPMEVRKNLYLIFKEATNNMVKYSEANRAFFAVKKEANNLIMLIRDNGKGFDMAQTKEGNGLINMKKRAKEIGARFMIDSHPGNGTSLQLKIAV